MRRMSCVMMSLGSRAALLAAALLCSGALFAADAPVTSELSVEQRLERVTADYAARAAELLATSKSPRERWIAGLMLLGEAMRTSDSAERSMELQTRGQKLLEQALKDGKDDATLLFWAILDPPLADRSNDAAMAQARSDMAIRLQQLEPDNAVVWLGTLPPRDAAGAIPIAIEMLAKAAAAKRFDTHFASSMRMLLGAFARVPLPEDWPDTSALPGWEGVERADLQVIMAVGISSTLAMPYLVSSQWWCGGNSSEQPWLDDCRKLADLMVQHSDSIVPRSLGLAIQAQLHAADSDQLERATAQRRELAWLVENGLQHVGPGQPLSFGQWRKAWSRPKATEISVARELVKLQRLPVNPPDDFVPAWDREPLDGAN